MHRRLISFAAAAVMALGGLLAAPTAAQAAPAPYKIHSTVLGAFTASGTQIPVTVTFSCPAGQSVEPMAYLSGIGEEFRNQWTQGTRVGGGSAYGLGTVACTGQRQTVSGYFMTNWTPLTFVGYLPTKNVKLETSLVRVEPREVVVTDVRRVNAGNQGDAAGHANDYRITAIRIGNISADRRTIPFSFDYTCPSQLRANLLVYIDVNAELSPGQTYRSTRLGGIGEVSCTGRKQTYESTFQADTRYFPAIGYFQTTPDATIVVQIGPLEVRRVVSVR